MSIREKSSSLSPLFFFSSSPLLWVKVTVVCALSPPPSRGMEVRSYPFFLCSSQDPFRTTSRSMEMNAWLFPMGRLSPLYFPGSPWVSPSSFQLEREALFFFSRDRSYRASFPPPSQSALGHRRKWVSPPLPFYRRIGNNPSSVFFSFCPFPLCSGAFLFLSRRSWPGSAFSYMVEFLLLFSFGEGLSSFIFFPSLLPRRPRIGLRLLFLFFPRMMG